MVQRDWQSILLRLAVVLAALLILLAALAVLYVCVQVLQLFGGVIVLFVVGAIVAYMLNPAVDRVSARVGKRWAGTVIVYVGLAAALVIVGVLVFQPLVTQSSSLVNALKSPPARSLHAVSSMANEATTVRKELVAQRDRSAAGRTITKAGIRRVEVGIAALQGDMAALKAAPSSSSAHPAAGRSTRPSAQVRVPPSYLHPLQAAIAALAADYGRPTPDQPPTSASLSRSISDAGTIVKEAKTLRRTLSSTPVLLLDAQTWTDEHNIGVDVQASAGQALKKASDQAASLLTNTAAVLEQTATLLLDLVLILIISVYFVIDGERMLQSSVTVLPSAYQAQATAFLTHVDEILGGYIRAQLLLALLAGFLAGIGSAVLGVPYPVVIGVGTFFLQLLPVIGPILVYIPPLIIALLFTSVPTTLVLLAYLIVMEQVVTNVIGPRVSSKSVGIHPLEAMAAALIGYIVGGFLGAFLAVPIVGVAHVVIAEAYGTLKSRSSKPSPAGKETTATADQQEPSQSRELTAASGRPAGGKEG